MIISGVLIFILSIFVLLKNSKSGWMSQFVFLTFIALSVHVLSLAMGFSTIALVVVNVAAFVFLILMFFAMAFFKGDSFPHVTNKLSLTLSGLLWAAVLGYYTAGEGLVTFLSKSGAEIKSTNVSFVDFKKIFLSDHMLVNFYTAVLLFVVLIFCVDVIFNQEK